MHLHRFASSSLFDWLLVSCALGSLAACGGETSSASGSGGASTGASASNGSGAGASSGVGASGGATGAGGQGGSPSAGTPVPPAALGMVYHAPPANYPVYTGMFGKRPGTSWHWLVKSGCNPLTQSTSASDPSNPCYAWAGLDAAVDSAATHGVPIVYDFDHAADYAVRPSGTICSLLDQTAVETFATALATRYKGKIRFYEAWNEINDWSCSGTGWQDTWENDATQACWIYQAIKAVDPNALVGAPNMAGGVYAPPGTPVNVTNDQSSGGDFTVWLDRYLSAGGDQCADAIGFHAYGTNAVSFGGHGVYTVPELGCDADQDKLHCASTPLLTMYQRVRAAMDAHGLAGKPIVVSEGGWGNDAQPTSCNASIANTGCLTLEQQPAYVARWVVLTASTWADGLGEYAQWYMDDGDWGTLDGSVQDGIKQSTDAAKAWNQAADWVIGATFMGSCHGAGSLIACDLVRAGGTRAQIVFNDDKDAVTPYAPPSWASTSTPILGAASPVAGAVDVGPMPVLIE